MARIIEIENNDDFKSCDNCIHSDDTAVICKMRGCIHAILDGDIKECYRPKERGKINENFINNYSVSNNEYSIKY